MNKQKHPIEPEPKNRLFEKVIDINKLILPRGMVLLEEIDTSSNNKIILPEGVDRGDFVYFKVIKSGTIDFAAKHPDSANLPEGITKVGNIVLTMRQTMFQLLSYKDRVFIIVPESNIQSQVTPDNFKC